MHRIHILLVVSTHLKNISQIGSLPQIGVKIKNVLNHHPDIIFGAPTDIASLKQLRLKKKSIILAKL